MVNLGIAHSEGSEVPHNYIEAYRWLDVALHYTRLGDDKKLMWRAQLALDDLVGEMNPYDLEQAKAKARLLKQWASKLLLE